MNKKAVAIIPARGGSKEVLGKNIKCLIGKPLIYYTIQTALSSPLIDDVFISTDSASIKDISLKSGAKVIDRPKEISTDESISEDAILHALHYLDKNLNLSYDICVFMQATSPLTLPEDLNKLIALVTQGKDSAAFFVRDYGNFFGIDDMTQVRLPRQMREPKKREVGNAWSFKVGGFLKYKSRLFGDIGFTEIEEPRHLEIDSISDFYLIECIMQKKLKRGGII